MKIECVFYSPQLDHIAIFYREEGFIFTDEFGEHQLWYDGDFKTYAFYIIGEL